MYSCIFYTLLLFKWGHCAVRMCHTYTTCGHALKLAYQVAERVQTNILMLLIMPILMDTQSIQVCCSVGLLVQVSCFH